MSDDIKKVLKYPNKKLRNDSSYSDKDAIKIIEDGLNDNKVIKMSLPGSRFILGVFRSQVLEALEKLKKEKI